MRALPAGVDLVAGVDVPTVLAHPALGARVRGASAFGIEGGLHGLDQVVLGCGEPGCVALIDGTVDRASFAAVQGPTEHLIAASGWKGRLDRLGEGKLVVGDRQAVRWIRRTHRDQLERFEGGWLQDLVPAGPIWAAARDPGALAPRSTAWLSALGLPELQPLLAGLERNHAALEQLEGDVEAMALALDPDQGLAVVRLRARSTAAALKLATALRTRRIERATSQQVARQGLWVELVCAFELDEVLR